MFPVLQQKEHISTNSFDDIAEKLHPEKEWLQDSLEDKKKVDEYFGNSRA